MRGVAFVSAGIAFVSADTNANSPRVTTPSRRHGDARLNANLVAMHAKGTKSSH